MQQHRVERHIVHEEQILEAIDQLRRRKARPDADRICNYLLRKFSVDARDTIADLHRLIEAEKVIQVDYKGNTSYRNASKWSRLQLYKNRPEGFVKEKLNSSMIAGAVAELVVEEPDYLDTGVPAYRLVEQLLDGLSNPTSRRMVEDFLGKEVASGNLTRLSNGNYSLVATSDMAADQQPTPETYNNVNGKTENGGGVLSQRSQSTKEKQELATLYDFEETNEDLVADSRSNTPRLSRQASPKGETTIVTAASTSNGNNNNSANNNNGNLNAASIKKEDCYEIILGNVNGNSENEDNGKIRSNNIDKKRERDRERDRGRDHRDNDNDNENEEEDEETESSTMQQEDSRSYEKEKDNNVRHKEKESKKTEEVIPNHKRSSKAERKQRLLVRMEDPMDIEIKFEDYRREKDKRDESEHLSEERDDDDAGRSSANASPTLSNANANTGFRSARRKRAKKVFDPSDNNVVKRKRGKPSSTQNKVCTSSQESQESTKSSIKETPYRKCSLCSKDKQESLVACRDCTNRAHPSCIYPLDEIAQKAGSSWQCERCKSCAVCCETAEAGPLVTCTNCDEAYHHLCHSPKISASRAATAKWQCSDCNQKQYKTSTVSQSNSNNNHSSTNNNSSAAVRPETPMNTSVLPPVLSPQVSPTRTSLDPLEDEPIRDGIDPNIPDASDWTSEQVYQYFARLFPKEAEVFRQQDIDGHSLLLMKRSDVLSGLDLLLGPALKIYRHVLKLQVRRDDPRLYWL